MYCIYFFMRLFETQGQFTVEPLTNVHVENTLVKVQAQCVLSIFPAVFGWPDKEGSIFSCQDTSNKSNDKTIDASSKS